MKHTLNPWPEECSPQYAAERTKLLFSCFRRNEASDAKTFVTAIAALLARYPADVVTQVTHPVDGLPSAHTFPPSLAEVKTACEKLMAPIYAARRRSAEAERTKHMLAPPVVPPESRERAVRRWFDEIRPSMIPAAKQTATKEEAAARLMELGGITKDQLDAIPDAKQRSTFERVKA